DRLDAGRAVRGGLGAFQRVVLARGAAAAGGPARGCRGIRPRVDEHRRAHLRGLWLHDVAVGGGAVPRESHGSGGAGHALAIPNQLTGPALGRAGAVAAALGLLLLPAAEDHSPATARLDGGPAHVERRAAAGGGPGA